MSNDIYGHNSGDMTDAAVAKLQQIIDSVEALEDEKKEIAEQIKEVYGEAKSMGYDTKVLRKIVRIRKMDQDKREEEEAVLEAYMIALGL